MRIIRQLTTALLLLICIESYATSPSITGFSPANGPVGTLVTITGTNLSNPTAFTIGGVPAIAVSNTGTTLVGMVMPGAATGAVSVSTSGGSANASGNFSVLPTPYPGTQQSTLPIGTGNTGPGYQGRSVSLSADGNTAIVGGFADASYTSAAWVYTRSGGIWTQQGNRLMGTGAISGSQGVAQGTSVSLSADGNTAILGAPRDNNDTGAVWIFTRTGSTWTQQGGKLVGTGVTGYAPALQGTSVSLSADGNTAIVGGPNDGSVVGLSLGAAWIFTRSGGIWSQQGPKLVGTGSSTGTVYVLQGESVALSADGNTAMVGGPFNNQQKGAVWVYTRSGTTWTQQAPPLVGSGIVDSSFQGSSIALSADGKTAIIGGWQDNNSIGAAWIFTQSGGAWTQQGLKLVGTGAVGRVGLGHAVALSADGNIAIMSGPGGNSGEGAVWVFARSGGIWTQQGTKLVGTGGIGVGYQGVSVSLSADGKTALVSGPSDNNNTGKTWVFGPSCNPTANFTLSPTSTPHYWDIVNLCTGNNLSYVWNWGDGTANSTSSAPSHTYSTPGYYNVCVQVTDTFGCIASYCDSNVYLYKDQSGQMVYVNVIPLGINSISGTSTIHLYPNPNTGTFTLQTTQKQNATYTISDMMGQIIKQENITSDSQLIDIGSIPTGIYMLSITDTSEIVKFTVMR